MKKNIISKNITINEAISKLYKLKNKILIYIKNEKIHGVLTEGDIMDSIDKGFNFSDPVSKIINKKFLYIKNVNEIQNLFLYKMKHNILHVPLINNSKLKKIFFYEDVLRIINKKNKNNIKFISVIMAGGLGKRMKNIFNNKPKPLLQDRNGKPIIINMINKLNNFNINSVYVTLFYKADIIKKIINKSCNFSNIKFIKEKKPLGTIGSISMVENKKKLPIFLINCDTLINLNIDNLVNFHKKNKNDLTIVSCEMNNDLDYGVIRLDKKKKFKGIQEKFVRKLLVNTGAYVLSPKAASLISPLKKMDIDYFVNILIKKKLKINIFPIHRNMWNDVGTKEKYFNYLNQ